MENLKAKKIRRITLLLLTLISQNILAQDFQTIQFENGKLKARFLPIKNPFLVKGNFNNMANGDKADIVYAELFLKKNKKDFNPVNKIDYSFDSSKDKPGKNDFTLQFNELTVGNDYKFQFNFIKILEITDGNVLNNIIEKVSNTLSEKGLKTDGEIIDEIDNEVKKLQDKHYTNLINNINDSFLDDILKPKLVFLTEDVKLDFMNKIKLYIGAKFTSKSEKNKNSNAETVIKSLFKEINLNQSYISLIDTTDILKPVKDIRNSDFNNSDISSNDFSDIAAIDINEINKLDKKVVAFFIRLRNSAKLYNTTKEQLESEIQDLNSKKQDLLEFQDTNFITNSNIIINVYSITGSAYDTETVIKDLQIHTDYGFAFSALNPFEKDSYTNFYYAALRIYFKPIDKSARHPYDGIFSRSSIFVGTLGVLASNKLSYKGQDMDDTTFGIKPVIGYGFDPSKYFGLNLGVVFFNQKTPNSLSSLTNLRAAPFISLSFDFNILNRIKNINSN